MAILLFSIGYAIFSAYNNKNTCHNLKTIPLMHVNKNSLFGQYLLRQGVINNEQLQNALKMQSGSSISLGELCKTKGLLTEEEVKQILLSQWKSNQPFGEIATSLELLTPQKLDELLGLQRLFHQPLGEILVEYQYVTQTELDYHLEHFEIENKASKDILAALKNVDLFSALTVKELANISLSLKIFSFRNGDVIYQEGDASDYLYLIESGQVRISMHSREDNLNVSTLGHGSNFGLYSVLNHKPRIEKAEAIDDVNLWGLNWSDLHGLLVEHPSLSVRALKILSENIEDIIFSFRDEQALQDLHLTSLIIDDSCVGFETYGLNLVESVAKNVKGNTLLLSCIDVTQTSYNIKALKPELISQTLHLYSLYLPDAISGSEIKNIIRILQKRPLSFRCIIILISSSSKNLIQDILNISKKSIMICHKQILQVDPNTTDKVRIYLAQEPNQPVNEALYRKHLLLNPTFPVPSLFYPEEKNKYLTYMTRWLCGHTIGLAFGGGGARTMVNVGVVEVLEEAGIPIDMVSGSSGGALFGSLCAIGYDAHNIRKTISEAIGYGKDSPANDYTLTLKTIIKGKKYRRILKQAFGQRQVYDVQIPLYAISTDINTGQEVIINDCYLWEAIYVSSAIPGYSPLIEINKQLLGDGGLVNNVPSTVLKTYGADLVMSVNSSLNLQTTPLQSNSLPSLFGRCIDILVQHSVSLRSHYTDIEIRPKMRPYSIFDFKKGMEMFDLGRAAAEQELPKIQEYIKKLQANLQ